ncbi:hypothetical protein [Streptomyces sp. NBC_00096]
MTSAACGTPRLHTHLNTRPLSPLTTFTPLSTPRHGKASPL